MNIHFIHAIFPYHNFIISSIPFSGRVPIPCDTSQQFGSNYIWVFQTREVFTWNLEILLLNHHAYSVVQYENVKNMKNTFHQIQLLLFKILFDIRLKKTSPYFIHCSFKCSIFVLVYLWISLNLFSRWYNLISLGLFNSQSTKYVFFNKIRNSTLNIFWCFTSFS